MQGKRFAAFVALLLGAAAARAGDPGAALAGDPSSPLAAPTTLFYVSFPLGATSARERAPVYGLALQGRRAYQTVRVDSRMLSAFEGALAGIELKWLLVGGVAAAAGIYALSKDEQRSQSYSTSQNQQQSNPPPPPSTDCNDPCKK